MQPLQESSVFKIQKLKLIHYHLDLDQLFPEVLQLQEVQHKLLKQLVTIKKVRRILSLINHVHFSQRMPVQKVINVIIHTISSPKTKLKLTLTGHKCPKK